MAVLDLDTPEDRVRLNLGDTSDMPFLATAEITYSLSVNSGNENAATKQCAQFILAKMAYSGHEKLGQLEFWGETVFNQFRTYLKDIVNNPIYSGTAGIYVGGVDRTDIINNINDMSIIHRKFPNFPYQDYCDDPQHVYGIEPDGYEYY